MMMVWLARYAVLRLLPRSGNGHGIMTARYGGLRLTLDWLASEHVPLREVLVREEYWLDRSWLPSAGDTVVDVGANAGIFTVASADLVGPTGRVVAFEPNSVVLGRLRANVRQNGFSDRVTVLPVAIADHAGRGTVRNETGNSTIARVHLLEPDETARGEAVSVETLDEALASAGVKDVDLLKVDVEGLELAVLDAGTATLARSRRVVVEVGGAEDAGRIEALFRDAGLTRITRRSAGPDSGAMIVFADRPDAA